MIENLFITSILCIGTHEAIQLLYFTLTRKDLLDQYISLKWWSKPLWSCPSCMASLWGSFYFIIINHFDLTNFSLTPVDLKAMIVNSIGLVFVNSFLSGLLNRL